MFNVKQSDRVVARSTCSYVLENPMNYPFTLCITTGKVRY